MHSVMSLRVALIRNRDSPAKCSQERLPFRGIHYLIVKYGEVESKPKSDWVSRWKILVRSFRSSLKEWEHSVSSDSRIYEQ